MTAYSTITALLTAASLLSLVSQPARAESLPNDLRTAVELYAHDKDICAVAYATVRAGEIAELGAASGCDGGIAPTPDSIFQAASLSKPVFAYAVLNLVQEGMLDLDAPLVGYLPQGYLHVQNPFAFGRPPIAQRPAAPELQAVTARMVLNHTSGMPNWSDGPLAFDFKPGAGWQYSGEGFMLLQRVIESITNQELDDFMRERVFGPLGMSNSSFRWKPEFAAAFVPGTPSYIQIPSAMAPMSLHTSARDYARFLSALMKDRQALKLTTQSPASAVPKLNLGWGLGWGIEHGGKESYLWQWGNNPGYRAFVMGAASTGDAVVIFTNSDKGLSLAEPIVSHVLPDTHKVFRSHLVREGLSYFLCEKFGLCV